MNNDKKKSFLTFLKEKMTEYEDLHPDFQDTHHNFTIIGVEFTDEGVPGILINRGMNSYANQIASLDILKTIMEEDYHALKDRLKKTEIRKGNGISDSSNRTRKSEVEDLLQALRDKMTQVIKDRKKDENDDSPSKSPKKSSGDDILDQIKKQFGFDGDSNLSSDGSIRITGSSNIDDED